MKKGKKRRIVWWSAIGVATVAFTAYWLFGSGPKQKPVLETAAVEFGDVTVELPATGSIDAVNVIDVGSVVSGRIKAMYADFNDHVKAGQLLAEIEDDNYRGIYLQASADYEMAKAAIGTAQADLETARADTARATADAQSAEAVYKQASIDYERNQKLAASGIVPAATLEQSQSAYLSAKADAASTAALVKESGAKAKAAEAALEQARATADQRAAAAALAKRNLDYCRITSPVDGIVVSRNMDAGQTVAARIQAPSLYHIAQDLSRMYVYTKLDSADIAKVRPGLPATFTVNAFPGETFEGKLLVVRINANPIDPISRAIGNSSVFKKALSAGTTVGSTSVNETTSSTTTTSTTGSTSGTSSTGASGTSATGASGTSGSTGTTAGTTASSIVVSTPTNTAGNPPPEGQVNTVVVYDALIEFQNPELKVLPGMTAYVTIPIAAVKDTLKVPALALRFSPNISAEEKQALLQSAGLQPNDPMVWVVTGEKKYRPVRVKPGLTDFVMTAVQAPDLKPGMQVATQIIEPRQPSS